MKIHLAFLLLALAFAVSTFAQESSYACDDQRIGGADYRVCDFGGKVTVDLANGTYHWAATFGTPSQFNAWKRKREALYADKHTNPKSEPQARSWQTQEFCEADGFKWQDNGCHVK